MVSQQARTFKKVQAKKLVKSNKSIFFHEIAFLAVFPVQKLIFGHFLNCKIMEFGQKKIFFCKIDLFDFTSFVAWTFLNFLALCET